MNEETVKNIANRIEEAGLKRHELNDAPELHHYVVELNYKKQDEDKIMDELPSAFESVCENELNDDCDGTFMFYLEDIDEAQANEVIDWLQKNTIWSNTDVPQCVC